jgi:hypothetical protein
MDPHWKHQPHDVISHYRIILNHVFHWATDGSVLPKPKASDRQSPNIIVYKGLNW